MCNQKCNLFALKKPLLMFEIVLVNCPNGRMIRCIKQGQRVHRYARERERESEREREREKKKTS